MTTYNDEFFISQVFSLIRKLSEGKTFTTKDFTLAMGENMDIGYYCELKHSNGELEIGVSGSLSFKDLFDLVKSQNLVFYDRSIL